VRGKGHIIMALTKEDLHAIGELMDSKIEPLSKRMDGFDKRMDGFDKRMDRLDETVQSVLESQIIIEDKVSNMSTQIEYLITLSDKTNNNEKRIDTLEDITNKHDTRIFKLENKKAV
jgi:chaperonin cofactor prefoldin